MTRTESWVENSICRFRHSRFRKQVRDYFAWGTLSLTFILPASAENPTGGQFAAGSGAISANGTTLNINTATDRAVVNWQSFSVDAGNTTNFNQPGINSAVLNRVVTPNNPSSIYGSLNSNGNVYLVNPSGVLVGPSGVINTNGFTASVLDIPNPEFMRGGTLHFRGDSRANVINKGTIRTDSGGAALLGNQVINEGLIESNGGSISLITGGSVRLRSGGTYTQADQATVDNGISETAALIRSSGTVRATGALEVGGEVYLVSPGGTVLQEGLIAAQDQQSPLETTGGRVVATGHEVNVTSGQIDASGSHAGGIVHIGGGYQGNDTNVLNSQATTIELGSTIQANATETGDGGEVVIWSDGATAFAGAIEAYGASLGEGGLVEVSGKQHLDFAGDVNTGGGQLLLDPYNYYIDSVAAANIEAALNLNHVTIQTSANADSLGATRADNNSENGDIFVNSAINWATAFDLTLLAHDDIHFNASVQNSGDINGPIRGGDIYIVAGWDGATPFNAKTFLAADVATTSLFGNSDGSVYIGNGVHRVGIAVGSRNGSSNVLASSLNITGSSHRDTTSVVYSGADYVFAQLGFRAENNGVEFDITGGINVRTTGAITALGGAVVPGYAQLGHVGADRFGESSIDASVEAPITIASNGNITFSGGGIYAYSQLGHGGYRSRGTHSGNITIIKAGDITFSGGDGWGAYSQLGHGGIGADGDHSGEVTLIEAGDLVFESGGYRAYSQFGHGGFRSLGTHSGNIAISQVGNIRFDSVDDIGPYERTAYTQLGHGGDFAKGNHSGDIKISDVGDVTFASGRGHTDDSQLGHGGTFAWGNHSGEITITNAGDLFFRGGKVSADTQLGHGGQSAFGEHSGDITLSNVGDLKFLADAEGSTRVGHGGKAASGNHSGDINIDHAGSLQFVSGGGTAQIGHGGYSSDGNHSGDISIVETGEITIEGGQSYAQLGHGGWGVSGKLSGDIGLVRTGDITLKGGSGRQAYSQLGHGGGGFRSGGAHSGRITITEAGDLLVSGGSASEAYSQVGHGGHGASGNHSGDITLTRTGSLGFWGGSGEFAGSQLGHGGATAFGKHSGAIEIVQVGDVTFIGGDHLAATSRLGHGGLGAGGGHSGNITINDAGSLTFLAGTGDYATTQLGHGGMGASGNYNGDIAITQVLDVEFAATEGQYAYSQLGHGGIRSAGEQSGDISVELAGDLSLTGVDTIDRYVVIGHGSEHATIWGNRRPYRVLGDVHLLVGGSAVMSNSVVGHLTIDSGGEYASGSTNIAVGYNNYVGSNTSDSLSVDANSRFFSASFADGGQLRLYLPNREAFAANVGAHLNGVQRYDADAGGSLNNEVGGFAAFEGGYLGTETDNYSFYFGVIDLSVIALSGSSFYGSTPVDPGLALVSGELDRGDTLVSIGLTTNFNFTETSAANTYTLTVDDSALDSLYNLVSSEFGTFTINPAPLTITANDQLKTYGDAFGFAGNEFTSAGLQNGETIDRVTLASSGTPVIADAVSHSIIASQPAGGTFDAANYDITFAPGEFNVDRAALTVTANGQSKTYGQSFEFTGNEFTSVGLQNGETIDSTTLVSDATSRTASVGDSVITVRSPNGETFDANNYDISFVEGSFDVSPATLTITADDQSKTYGQDFEFTGNEFTTAGLQNGESIGSVTIDSDGIPASANVAMYNISAANAVGGTFDAGNYDINFVDSTFSVQPAALTIEANSQAKIYGQTFAFSGSEFTAVGLQNGDTVGSVQLASGATQATVDVGTYPISASNASGGTFDAMNYDVTFVDSTFLVDPAVLTITADNQAKTYGQAFNFIGNEFSVTGLQNDETTGSVMLTSAATPVASDAGSFAIVADSPAGGTFDANNYSIQFVDGAFTVNQADLTITANSQTKPFGQGFNFIGTEFEVVGLQNGDVIDSATFASSGASPDAAVGSYSISITALVDGTANLSNYDVTLVDGDLLVSGIGSGLASQDAEGRYQDWHRTIGSLFSRTTPVPSVGQSTMLAGQQLTDSRDNDAEEIELAGAQEDVLNREVFIENEIRVTNRISE